MACICSTSAASWGGLAKYAAENYGCAVVGITISEQQQRFAEVFCRGLPIEIRLRDYRDVKESFRPHRERRNARACRVQELPPLHGKRVSVVRDRSVLCQVIGDIASQRGATRGSRRYIFPTRCRRRRRA